VAGGELGRENLARALDGLAAAIALDLIADCNTCSHVYRQALIPAILARLPAHCRLMQAITTRTSP